MANAPGEQRKTRYPEPVRIRFVIELSLPNFASLKSSTASVYSEKIITGKAGWAVGVYPCCHETGHKVQGPFYVMVAVRRRSLGYCEEEERKVEVIASVVGTATYLSNPGFAKQCWWTDSYPRETIGRGNLKFLDHSEIWGPAAKFILKDDTVDIRMELAHHIMYPLTSEECLRQNALEKAVQKRNRVIYDLGTGRDFTLVSSDGTERRVHKVFLMASSQVFRRMLESNLEECRSGRCAITDVDTLTLDALLRYVYYGCLEGLEEYGQALLVAADKYEILDLKEHCERVLAEGIDKDNVAELPLFAYKMSASQLKQAALRFLAPNAESAIVSGKIDSVLGTGYTSVMREIFAAVVTKFKK